MIFTTLTSGLLTKGVVDANGPGHPLLSLNGRKYFGRILKSDRSLAERVGDSEEVDEPTGRDWSITNPLYHHSQGY